jgi:hypothetical protein
MNKQDIIKILGTTDKRRNKQFRAVRKIIIDSAGTKAWAACRLIYCVDKYQTKHNDGTRRYRHGDEEIAKTIGVDADSIKIIKDRIDVALELAAVKLSNEKAH